MRESGVTRTAEIAYVVVILAVAGIVWRAASALPPAPYDPLGPKAFPIWASYGFAALGLANHRNHFPGELSLGLARRVALARAFAVEPDLLLLDEPFVSLDDALAVRLREELAELVTRSPVTTLLVTHDVEEAIGLADRLFLLSASPARVVAEVPIAHPRGALPPEERAAIRQDVAARLKGTLA